jgi:hypothetical protein
MKAILEVVGAVVVTTVIFSVPLLFILDKLIGEKK